MSAWTSFWFWLTILSIIGFIVVFVTIQVVTNYSPPLWIWYIYGISLAFLVVAFILYCYEAAQNKRVRAEQTNYLDFAGQFVPDGALAPACDRQLQQVRYMVPPPPTPVEMMAPQPQVVVKTPPKLEPKPPKPPCPPVPVQEDAFGAARLASPTTM